MVQIGCGNEVADWSVTAQGSCDGGSVSGVCCFQRSSALGLSQVLGACYLLCYNFFPVHTTG